MSDFGEGAKLVGKSRPGQDRSSLLGVNLMKKINDGVLQKSSSPEFNQIRSQITENCEELIEIGARIRPLIADKQQIGWVRGIHASERKLLKRWIYSTDDFVEQLLLLATTLTKEDLNQFLGVEINYLALLVSQMTDRDFSLYPYLSAFVTTSISENLWFSKGAALSAYEERVISLPDQKKMRILAPPDHAKLWSTLCAYRERAKKRLDDNFNSLMIVQTWAGKSAEPLRAELKGLQRSFVVDIADPWERAVKSEAITNLDDGWGHSMQDDSLAGLQRELKGTFEGDRHEKFMEIFYQQQKDQAEAKQREIEAVVQKRGGPGVHFEPMTILTEKEVHQREKELRKGIIRPKPVENVEVIISPEEKIQKYR